MADSILKDYMKGLFGANMVDATPGLFWLPGEVTKAELTTKYKAELEKARVNQTRYWQSLVRLSDALWARTNGNPMAIPEDAKLAVKEFDLTIGDFNGDSFWKTEIDC
jgi:hypothetical protein